MTANNVFNTVQYSGIDTTLNSQTFGQGDVGCCDATAYGAGTVQVLIVIGVESVCMAARANTVSCLGKRHHAAHGCRSDDRAAGGDAHDRMGAAAGPIGGASR